jgi:hypothetical protein
MKRSKLSKSWPFVRSDTNRSVGLGSSAIVRLRAEFDLRDVASVTLTSQDGPIEHRREVLIGEVGGHSELGSFERQSRHRCPHSPRVRLAATTVDILDVVEGTSRLRLRRRGLLSFDPIENFTDPI